jgi:hypothetical protein
MITYLTLTFSSEGSGPKTVTEALKELGFTPSRGVHDYTYDWGKHKRPDVEEIMNLLEKLHMKLKGLHILYQVSTL